ncbi:hypothetical protein CRP01_04545 [Flavilitoribacter nigricans DSM 23189 = NBRC 102662]|uniref:Uncharacterized protein n=1 Tax=Flavilitoribacter nigricans (strain ATCC 23147 / DSM 23189 / NBRC 102662 / NCIMB 1420 / SS-2) TaxID=1122177 RepID=A0A2D0NH12_FLAN2|nr:hypothetical protein CRP01_04545 [Flavilitoribacter nigricans DSM 23189 = NBRC 102662]
MIFFDDLLPFRGSGLLISLRLVEDPRRETDAGAGLPGNGISDPEVGEEFQPFAFFGFFKFQ